MVESRKVNVAEYVFEGREIRVQIENGAPWFLAFDVCSVLGFGNPRQAIASHVDSEDVQKLDALTNGGKQLLNYVNESGLYSLILGSTKPEAKRFKRWVTSVVLPEIRKTGSYSVVPQVPRTFAEALRLAADLQDKLEEQRPAVEFLGRYVEAKSSKNLTEVAKVLGWKPRAFIDELNKRGIIYRRGENWLPKQEQIDNGRFTVKTGEEHGHAYLQTRVEPKGLAWLADALGKKSD